MHGPPMQQNEIGAFTKRFNVKAHLAQPPFHIAPASVAFAAFVAFGKASVISRIKAWLFHIPLNFPQCCSQFHNILNIMRAG